MAAKEEQAAEMQAHKETLLQQHKQQVDQMQQQLSAELCTAQAAAEVQALKDTCVHMYRASAANGTAARANGR